MFLVTDTALSKRHHRHIMCGGYALYVCRQEAKKGSGRQVSHQKRMSTECLLLYAGHTAAAREQLQKHRARPQWDDEESDGKDLIIK